jgi:hypothetical protein
MSDQAILNKVILPIDDKYQIDINHFRPYENSNIFNEKDYFQLHSNSLNDIYVQLVRITTGKVYATIAFYNEENGLFTSPRRGTFGGIVLNEPVEMQLIEKFLYAIKKYLIKIGSRAISIKCPPFSHDLALSSIVTNVLLRQGFRLSGHELNYDLSVDERPFSDRIDYGNDKRIRKCLRESLFAEQVDSVDYPKIYEVIKDNRERRGFPISLSLEQLGQMVEIFPGKMYFFAVYQDAERSVILAAAVCIALTDSILYVFYWGDAAGAESYSPIALLASTIYNYCQQQGFKVLDVGTSTVSGEPNYGLVKFKRNLGFSESLKLSFVWEN